MVKFYEENVLFYEENVLFYEENVLFSLKYYKHWRNWD